MADDPMELLRRRAMELRSDEERQAVKDAEAEERRRNSRVAVTASELRTLSTRADEGVRRAVHVSRSRALRVSRSQGHRATRSRGGRATGGVGRTTDGVARDRDRLAAAGARLDAYFVNGALLAMRVGRRWRWPAFLLALLVWWPTGFSGRAPFPQLPRGVADADLLVLGAVAGGLAMGALVRELPHLGEWTGVIGLVCWTALAVVTTPWSTGPVATGFAVALAVTGGLVGLLLGSTARSGLVSAATVLALLAAVSAWSVARGPVLAVALVIPFISADRRRVPRTVVDVARVLVVWFLAAWLVAVVHLVWGGVSPGAVTGPESLWSAVTDGARETGFHGAWAAAQPQVAGVVPWLWVALVLALLLVALNVLLALAERERGAGGDAAGADDLPAAVAR